MKHAEILLGKIKALLALEYVYANEPAAPKPEKNAVDGLLKAQLATLPETLIKPLHDAALSADIDRILELVQRLESHDGVVAGSLRSLAEAFDYEALQELTAT